MGYRKHLMFDYITMKEVEINFDNVVSMKKLGVLVEVKMQDGTKYKVSYMKWTKELGGFTK